MLNHLDIRNFAIVPSLSLDFARGFTVITGETGAGKSILVDALGLLLGRRSDASWVRQGAGRAELTAEFDLERNDTARQWLDDNQLDTDGQCLLRRSISSSGRSRAWINGTPVTVQQLSELGALLVEIHGQNEHLHLVRPGHVLDLLDRGDHNAEQVQAVRHAFEQWREAHEAYEATAAASSLAPEEREFLQYQFSELQAAVLSPEDLAALEREHRTLAKGGELMEALRGAADALEQDEGGAIDGVASALRRLRDSAEFRSDIAEAATMVEEALINLQEATAVVRSVQDDIDLSPERLAQVEQQLSTLADLARKHRVDMDELGRVRDEIEARLSAGENFEQQRERLQKSRDQAL
ncbi:MAG: AAA family ATPase, partial [Xanthomonadales bacterium]|nr:AAA family ATPase [Xanthomonadales bacterium]